ncbi:alpha-amylase family glycosyl hydrolase [Polymorphospora sp. NPDC050346]|uniref:alpha-amylase family glycosyl hydrolase n=1 Tax=Polymorphospora sp. NPDC050346 TaxID=3155780 RepID=UPI0033EC00BA
MIVDDQTTPVPPAGGTGPVPEPAPDSLAGLPAGPAGPGHPSPADWRDEVLYSVLVDRFEAGPRPVGYGDPADGDSRHGGNLAGITSRLDYLRDLGVTTLLLSPVTRTTPDSYHGYAPVHLLAVDPYLGSLADLRELVGAAHRHGIRVVLDLVVNHAARIFEYEGGDDGWKGAAHPAPIGAWTTDFKPAELAVPEHFSRRGQIADWKDPDHAALGDFPPGYRRLATENPATRVLLLRVARWWLRETDADGVRLDAIRHLDPDFVRELTVDLKRYAATMGKHNLLVLGEYSSTADGPIVDSLALGFDSAYNYPEYRRQSRALHGAAPARDLADSLATAADAFGPHLPRLVRFIDNHDVYRFLRDGEPDGRLRVALAFLMFSIGIPMLYYGTEQGFRQPTRRLERECSADRAAPRNREDMFAAGRFVSASSAGDRFDTSSAMFRWTRRLADVRRRFVALRRGDQVVRWSDPDGPGGYVFSRRHGHEEVVVVLNTADEPRRVALDTGGRWADVLDPGYAGPSPEVDVDAFGVRVLVRTGPR